MADLLLYSMLEFAPIIKPLIQGPVEHVVEIGSEAGGTTRALVGWLDSGQIKRLTVVEPEPSEELREWAEREDVTLYATTSEVALPLIDAADVYLVDGDHNYYTVGLELSAIMRTCKHAGTTPILLFHDVTWPRDRRDSYYAPRRIPHEARHPHSYGLGEHVDFPRLVGGGLRGEGAYALALTRGGPRNGVLTAIEDQLRPHQQWRLFVVPAFFGLGVVVSTEHPNYAQIEQRLEPYADNPFIARLERNRLDLYLRVIELQDCIAAMEQQEPAARPEASVSAPSPGAPLSHVDVDESIVHVAADAASMGAL